MPLNLDMVFMITCISAGLFLFFQKGTPFHFKLFPFFLLFSLIIEIIAGYLINIGKHTTELYNIWDIIYFTFYIYLMSNIISEEKARKICHKMLLGFIIFAILNISFFQQINTYNSVTYAIGCLLIVALSVYYFYELFRLKQYLVLTREPSFWITTGILFYFPCSFPLVSSANFIQNIPNISIESLQSLLLLMNILLYSLFTIAFLCRIKIRKFI